MALNARISGTYRKLDIVDDYPLLQQLRAIIDGTRLNACLIAASLRPEAKIAVQEFVSMQGGYESVAHEWVYIIRWIKDEFKKGVCFDRELRDLLIGLAATIRAKELKVG